MSYRVEISPNNRAGCQATHCKDQQIKILKGEIRQGVLVDFQGNQSMRYRHWGCVTPQVLHNWNESAQGDMDLVDGWDELPAEAQETVKTALEVGHVDDETWNGDIECNRYQEGKRSQGMFLKGKAKAAKEAAAAGEEPEAPKKTAKKRSRKDAESEEADVEPRPAKKRGKKAAANADEDGEAESKPAPKKRGKKAAAPAEVNDEEAETKPAPKKRGKKAVATPAEDDEAAEEAPAPKKGRGKKVKAETYSDEIAAEEDDAPKPAAAKKGRGKKTVLQSSDTLDHDGEEIAAAVKAPAKKGRGRPKKAAAAAEEED